MLYLNWYPEKEIVAMGTPPSLSVALPYAVLVYDCVIACLHSAVPMYLKSQQFKNGNIKHNSELYTVYLRIEVLYVHD